MTDQQVINLIKHELKEKTLKITEQYLEIHSPVYNGTELQVERVDRERDDGLLIAYLPVLGEKFYFAVYIDTQLQEVTAFASEANNTVYLRATSETLSVDELKSITRLQPSSYWNKGDVRKNRKSKHTFSNIEFLPNPEPDEFEDKLKKLLSFLEQDRDGIKRLAEHANSLLQITIESHNGNGMIGGPHISKENIERIWDLGLFVDFDLDVSGKSFKEDSPDQNQSY